MLKDAVAYYHELLNNDELAESSRRMLDEGLESARLIFGGRRLTPYLRPFFVTEDQWAFVKTACESVWSAMQKVKDAAIEDPSIMSALGLSDIEQKLIAIDPGYKQVSPTARLDSFLTENSYNFVELNGESPAGIAYADAAYEIFSRLPVMVKFCERFVARPMFGRDLLLNALLRAYDEYLGRPAETKPLIAIVDLKDLPTQKEFELFRDFFEERGYPSVICSPDELVWDGASLSAKGRRIDIVYKRLLVNEYLPIIDQFPALRNACEARAVCMVNSFRSKIIHKKAIFAVLTDERYSELFDPSEREAISRHVPWTRMVTRRSTFIGGEEVNLVEFIESNRDRLVLKPNDDYGGHGIFIGWNSDLDEWRKALEIAIEDGDYLVQERVATAREVFPTLKDDSSVKFEEQLVDLDPLLFFGKVGSAFTRLSSTELANVSSGGGMVPTYIISSR